MDEKIPFSLLYEKMQNILAKPELYALGITRFSAGGLGACAYERKISIAELVACWQHKEYQIRCPECGGTAYITQWAGSVNSGGYWEINAYCPHCGKSTQFHRNSYPKAIHNVHWTKMRNIVQEEKTAIKNKTDKQMETENKNPSNKNTKIGQQPTVDHEKMTIRLLNGRTLQCYPRVEALPHIDNRMKLDTTGQYLIVGRKKTAEQQTSPELEKQRMQAEKFFTDHAFFFLDHREQILNDSRMFLAPVPVQSGLAYVGTSGFNRPTLGVYIEWWMTCVPAIIGRYRKNTWLTYHIAGSPLSGRNHCGIVNPQGKCESYTFPVPFKEVWSSFTDVNKRYDEAKERYEAYSLEEVVKLLETNDRGDSLTERMVSLLQRENLVLRQTIVDNEKASTKELETKSQAMETMRITLLKEYLESKREKFEEWYADYSRKHEELRLQLDVLKIQKKQLKQQLQDGEITNKFHQQQLTPLKDRISNLEFKLANMGVISLSYIIPKSYKGYLTPDDVIAFLDGKMSSADSDEGK